jgi:hypothetical protein
MATAVRKITSVERDRGKIESHTNVELQPKQHRESQSQPYNEKCLFKPNTAVPFRLRESEQLQHHRLVDVS